MVFVPSSSRGPKCLATGFVKFSAGLRHGGTPVVLYLRGHSERDTRRCRATLLAFAADSGQGCTVMLRFRGGVHCISATRRWQSSRPPAREMLVSRKKDSWPLDRRARTRMRKRRIPVTIRASFSAALCCATLLLVHPRLP